MANGELRIDGDIVTKRNDNPKNWFIA
ncbi:uncharacterized protein METZ01_LOCUS483850 [marine metagenome]|uniref:Uncharacterized protein n=1 Tax=marine metagenome TaxID=408172 RepID=A0A383CF16_9ZZZZ